MNQPDPHAPQVSMVMPVYNGERFLCEALDSLLAQTFTDFEIVISDNASTDTTPEICKRYAAADARIKYHRQPFNCGVFANADFVMRQAAGRYAMIVGDDDVYDRTFISTLFKTLEADKSVGLAFSGFGYITPEGKLIPGNSNLNLPTGGSQVSGMIQFMFRRSALPMMMGLFKREVMQQALPFVAEELSPMTGDVDNVFLVRALSIAKSVNIKEPLFFYRLKDRASSFPHDWPASKPGQIAYMFKHHVRVMSLMQSALNRSDLPLLQKASLTAINGAAALLLFLRYSSNRFFVG